MKNQTPAKAQANFKKSVKGNSNIIDQKVHHLRILSKTNIQEESPILLIKLKLLHPGDT